MLGQSEMEMDLFDAVLRRLKQCEDTKCIETTEDRDRHYIESDFLVALKTSTESNHNNLLHRINVYKHVNSLCIISNAQGSLIANWFNPDDPSIKSQFIGEHITYDIHKCKLVRPQHPISIVVCFPLLLEWLISNSTC
jgi:hypothetical protein